MRLLVIGGTIFLGRHLVALALEAGHEVTTLNRGTHDLPEQANVEKLIADREGDLSVLAGRTFDAVIDTCGYYPEIVQHTLNALSGAVGTYVFISTISVYGEFSKIGIGENDAIKYTEPGEQGDYGSLKADCEKMVTWMMPECSLIIRPGLLAGPYDPTDRFTYWPARFAREDQPILVPARTERFIQYIDARDLATWVINMAAENARGVYIATGPEERLTLGAFFDACDQVFGNESKLTKVEDVVLEKAGVAPWTDLPFWIPAQRASLAGVMRLDRRKAVEAGLTCRPVTATITDTLAWDQTRDPSIPRLAGLSAEREEQLLRKPKLELNPGRGPLPGVGLK